MSKSGSQDNTYPLAERLERLENAVARVCERIEALEGRTGTVKSTSGTQLPSETKGRGRRENLTGLHEETLVGRSRQDVDLKDVYERFMEFPNIYERRHLEVLTLFYRDQLTRSEMSDLLGISESMVGRHLKQAKRRYSQFRMRQKREIYASLVPETQE